MIGNEDPALSSKDDFIAFRLVNQHGTPLEWEDASEYVKESVELLIIKYRHRVEYAYAPPSASARIPEKLDSSGYAHSLMLQNYCDGFNDCIDELRGVRKVRNFGMWGNSTLTSNDIKEVAVQCYDEGCDHHEIERPIVNYVEVCKYCGAHTTEDPSDQSPPIDYCSHDSIVINTTLTNEQIDEADEALVEPTAGWMIDEDALEDFCAAMSKKLANSRAKGRSGWNDKTICSNQRLSDMLRSHVEKGDPRDVANLCMMLYARGESILPANADVGEYSQGVCSDGAAILKDGVPMTVDEVVAALNAKLPAKGGDL
jgi:hypothetical protein